MEFVIRKNDLVHELQTIAGVVEKRATIPILSNLLLEAREDGLHIRASDLEVSIRGSVKATVVENGEVTLPAAKLLEIARSLPDAEIQFKLKGTQMGVSCERSRFKLAGQGADEFPAFPELDTVPTSLPGKILRAMIERVAFAITTEDPRYSLNGALLRVEANGICLVATDGHRLAFCRQEVSGIDLPEGPIEVIVPRKALSEVLKLSSNMDDEQSMQFGIKGNHVFFSLAGHELVSTIPEGPFPSYKNVLPEASSIAVTVPSGDLLAAVRRVSLMASDRFGKAVRFALSSGKLELSYESDMGNAQEQLTVDYDGDPVEIGFNARYFQDFLNVVGTENVQLELGPMKEGEEGSGNTGDKPGQLRPEPAGDMDYRYVVMPMHLL
jgi:DNA polymerase-3 subunit beta